MVRFPFLLSPLFPLIYTDTAGNRTNWLVMILAGVAFAFVAIVKETYGPTILRKRAAKMRKETGDPRWWSRFDEKKAVAQGELE
jgi:hypothetical protein